MDIRIFLFVLIVGLGVILRLLGGTQKHRNIYIDVILLALLLESCLRGLSVGSDTLSYSLLFKEAGQLSWPEVFKQMVDRYIYNIDDADAGYLLFERIVYFVSKDFQFFLFVCGLCFFLPFRRLLRWADLSIENLILLFVLYVALFNPIAMSGTRKEISLGISILCLLNYVDKKYVKALLWLLLGATIHATMLIILLFPLVEQLSIDTKKIVHAVSFLFIPVVIVFSSSILYFMATFIENEHYLMYAAEPEGGGATFVSLIELIFLGCLIFFQKSDLESNPKLNHLYSMLPMATVLVPLITNNGSMVRLSQYFHLYVLILLPILVEKLIGKSSSHVIRFVLIGILIFMSLRTDMLGSNYYFFWNDPVSLSGYDGYY